MSKQKCVFTLGENKHPMNSAMEYIAYEKNKTVEGLFKRLKYETSLDAKRVLNLSNNKLYINMSLGKPTIQIKSQLEGINTFFGKDIFKFPYTSKKVSYNQFRGSKGLGEQNDIIQVVIDPVALNNVIYDTMEDLTDYTSNEEKEAITWEDAQKKNIRDSDLTIEQQAYLTNLESLKGFDYDEQRFSVLDLDTSEDTQAKIKLMKEALNVNIILDYDIKYSRVDKHKVGEIPTIRLNPNKIFRDTVIHEVGHLYIDLLGGAENKFIQRAISELRGTDLWNKVSKNYPDLEEVDLELEVLATAIGIEGAELFKQTNKSSQSLIQRILDTIKELLGLDTNRARKLAKELLDNKLRELKSEGSSVIRQQRVFNKEEQIVNRAIDVIKHRIAIQTGKIGRESRELNKRALEGNKEKLEQLLKSLERETSYKAIISFVNNADQTIQAANNRLKTINDNKDNLEKVVDELKELRQFITVYQDILKDVNAAVKTNNELEDKMKASGNSLILPRLIADIQAINDIFKDYAKDYFAEQFAKKNNRIKGNYIEKYKQEFKQLNSNGSKADEDAYIQDMLTRHQKEIHNETVNYFRKIIDVAPQALSSLDAWITNPRSINDDIFQEVVELLDEADFKTTKRVNEKIKEANKVLDNYLAERGRAGLITTDSKSLYAPLVQDELDENAKPTGNKIPYLVDQYNNSYYIVRNYKASLVNWEDDNYRNSPEYKALKDWEKANTIKTAKGVSTPTAKWIDPNYDKLLNQKDATGEMYRFLLNVTIERDNMLFAPSRLKSKLPSIMKSTVERFGEQGFIKAGLNSFKDTFTLRPDEEGYEQSKQVLTTEEGLQRRSIPVYYRNKIKAEDQSYDLTNILMMDFAMATNFLNKNTLQADIEVIRELVAERRTIQREGGVPLINAVTKKILAPKAIDKPNPVITALDSIIEDRLYGIANKGKGHKVANFVIGWSSGVSMALNFFSPVTNTIQGKIMNWLESSNRHLYSNKDLLAADGKYWKDLVGITRDNLERTSIHSKTNLLSELFQMNSLVLPEFAKNTTIKRKGNLHTLSAMQTSSEHYVQNTMMYAVLNTIKVMDSKGNYLTKEGTTTDPKEAMSLDEAYILEDGRLQLDPRVVKSNKGPINESTIFNISRLLNNAVMNAQGNYHSNNRAMAQRYAVGKLAYNMRKWVEPGYKRRFRGISNLNLDPELRKELAFYNKNIEHTEEGTYVTALRFINQNIKDLKTFQFRLLSNFKGLSDYEKANVIKTGREAIIILGALITSEILVGLAEGADDEDEKARYYYLAFVARRTYSELFTYANPEEALRTLSTPTVTSRTVSDFLEVIQYLLPQNWDEWDEVYTRGKRKGKLKFLKEIEDILPVLKQFDRTGEDAYKFLIK